MAPCARGTPSAMPTRVSKSDAAWREVRRGGEWEGLGGPPFAAPVSGAFHWLFDGRFDGMFDGRFDGMFDGSFDGMFDGMFDGRFDGMFDGRARWSV